MIVALTLKVFTLVGTLQSWIWTFIWFYTFTNVWFDDTSFGIVDSFKVLEMIHVVSFRRLVLVRKIFTCLRAKELVFNIWRCTKVSFRRFIAY